MNLSIEPVKLVLSHLYITSFDALFMFGCVAYDTVFNAFFDLNLSIHVCLSLHATWHSSHHSLGNSDSPRPACSDLRV